tara:strand:+ start:440 stop:736 length:297 start_codon:yes stop_codon:yes gene_type:complete
MAAGDIVSGVFGTLNVWHTFIPAIGIEIMITFMGGNGTDVRGGITDGVVPLASGLVLLSDNADFSEGANVKCGITNTNYLQMYSLNNGAPGYSGLQLK